MSRKPPPQDDLEMNQMAQAELVRLQRQYRIMEGDRQSYTDEMKFYLEKQRKVIYTLEKEKDELITNLNISKSLHNEWESNVQSQRLLMLLSKQDELEDQIKTEKSQLTELESQIRKVEREVLNLKKKDIPELQLCEKAIECARNMDLLENRLYVATVNLNKMLTGNGTLRQEINHLLKERAHFNNLYQMLIGQFTTGKKIMLDLIEQATLAYDQREEAQAKLQALKERDRADLLLHSQEMRELQRRFDLDSKLQDFLGIKGQKRIMADLEAKEAIKKQQQKEATEQLITTYNSILEQIKEFSGESDVDRLAARFLKQEEENFTLFNYVNELNNELEVLQEQTNELMLSIDEQRNINKERAAQQQETITSLTEILESKMEDTREALRAQEFSITILDGLLKGVETLFSESRCDKAPILHLLGEEALVSTFNVMLFLGIIQQQIESVMVVPEPATLIQQSSRSKATPPSKTHSTLSSPMTGDTGYSFYRK